MQRGLILLGVALAAGALTACSQPKPAAPAASAAPSAAPPSASARVRGLEWVAKQKGMVPDWIDVANQARGGTVDYNAKSILRDAVTGDSEGWVQVTHTEPQVHRDEDAATVRTITYLRERALLRFRCSQKKVAVVERQFIGSDDAVVESFKTPPREEDFKAFPARSLPGVVFDEICVAR